MPMRILINATSARVGGGLTFIGNQLRAYSDRYPDDEVVALTAPWNHDRLSQMIPDSVRLDRRALSGTQERLRFEQGALGRLSLGFDVLYSPGNIAPLRTPPGVSSVLTLQNLAYFGPGPAFAGHRSPVERLKRQLVLASVRRAHAVMVPSQTLADAVNADMAKVAEKVAVVRPGPIELTGQDDAGAAGAGDRGRRGAKALDIHLTGEGYVLSVANFYDYKHLDHVVLAWVAAATRATPALGDDLVMVGTIPVSELMALRELVPLELRDRLHFIGAIDRPNLDRAYRNAAAVLCLSGLESLSLVPAEALSVGTPVVLSDIDAHREFGEIDGLVSVPVGAIDAAAGALTRVVSARRPAPANILGSWSDHAEALRSVFTRAGGGSLAR